MPAPEHPRVDQDREKAARTFEAYMVSFLASTMRSTCKDGPFNAGAAGMFAQLFDQEIGERVASTGAFGLQDAVKRAMEGTGGIGGDGRGSRMFTPVSTTGPHAHTPAPHAPEAEPDLSVGGFLRRVTSGFGVRANPLGAGHETHAGVDLGAPAGATIRAVKDGTVRFAGERGGYGNCVIVDHGDGTETRYAHCASLGVAPGTAVHAGQAIATVGSTGRSTGPHLHFEVRRNGAPIDPTALLAEGHAPLDF
jgi:murein DD-endopeptidase MepM/ murein hydrolase activator NlpD